jgi:hypothetical protein
MNIQDVLKMLQEQEGNPEFFGNPFAQNDMKTMIKSLIKSNKPLSTNPNFEMIYPSPAIINNTNPMQGLAGQNFAKQAASLTDPDIGSMFGGAAKSTITPGNVSTNIGGNINEFARNMVAKKSPMIQSGQANVGKAIGSLGTGKAAAASGAGNINGLFANLKSGGKALGGLAGKAVKYAPYLGGALMAGQGLSDIYESGKTQDEINELVGDIGSTARGTPMLGQMLDASTMRDVEQVQRRGSIRDETKGTSAVKGALGELPAAAATAALIALLTGGTSIPLSLAFGAGQLGLGATKGVKQSNETERARLQELYGQLSNARQMSRGMMKMPTQNYNVR